MSKKSTDAVRIIIDRRPDVAECFIRQLVERYGISEFDRKVGYADETDVEQFLKELEFLPAFSEKVLAVFKNIQYFTAHSWEALLPYLHSPYPHVCLILSGSELRGIKKKDLPKHVDLHLVEEPPPEKQLFSDLFDRKNDSREKVFFALRQYLSTKERNYAIAIAAVASYLRAKVSGGRPDRSVAERFIRLHELDAQLKTGRVQPDAGVELRIFQLLD